MKPIRCLFETTQSTLHSFSGRCHRSMDSRSLAVRRFPMKHIIIICVLSLFMVNSGASEEYWEKIPYIEVVDWGKVRDIAIEQNNTIWIGDSIGDIYRYLNASWEKIPCDSLGVVVDHINDIRIDNKKRIWFCCARKEGLNNISAFVYDGREWIPFVFTVQTEGSPDKPIVETFSSAEDKNGLIWFAGRGGIVRLNPDMTWQVYTKENSGLPDNKIGRASGRERV